MKPKKITLKFLERNDARQEDIDEVTEWGLLGLPADRFVKGLIEHDKCYYANWLIITLLSSKKQEVVYAAHATELILAVYSPGEYTDESEKALRAAKAYIRNPSKRTAAAAAAVVDAIPFDSIYNPAACAAYNTAYAASSKPYHNTRGAYAAVCYAIDAAGRIGNNVLRERIIEYGLGLLK